MKIGYPCLNLSLDCTSAKTFRLASFSEERFHQTVSGNLACLAEILRYNLEHHLMFFRITSDLIPFASHPICTIAWQEMYAEHFAEIGQFIRRHDMRISMHPGQFTLINSPEQKTFDSTVRELVYQTQVLDLMGLDLTARVQVHVGGVYGDKPAAMQRFIERFALLPERVQARLTVENDDRLYDVQDCYALHQALGIPVIFDNFHHQMLNRGEPVLDGLALAQSTWRPEHGLLMVDYSSQDVDGKAGKHTPTIDTTDFAAFLSETSAYDFDVMLEIKDKETSANKAYPVAKAARPHLR